MNITETLFRQQNTSIIIARRTVTNKYFLQIKRIILTSCFVKGKVIVLLQIDHNMKFKLQSL